MSKLLQLAEEANILLVNHGAQLCDADKMLCTEVCSAVMSGGEMPDYTVTIWGTRVQLLCAIFNIDTNPHEVTDATDHSESDVSSSESTE